MSEMGGDKGREVILVQVPEPSSIPYSIYIYMVLSLQDEFAKQKLHFCTADQFTDVEIETLLSYRNKSILHK